MTAVSIQPRQLNWAAIIVVSGIHLASLLVFVPWLFSWTGVALAVSGCFVFGTLGINLGFHRLLTHRSFSCPMWVERSLAILGVCCLQKTPGQFVATHRAHHQHEDHEGDPHSPLKEFFWGHMGWLFVLNPDFDNISTYERLARDVYRDRFYLGLERNFRWLQIYVAHTILYFVGGFVAGWVMPGGTPMAGLQFGLSLLVWGAWLRTVLVWHITWSVNSIGHIWGYQNYKVRGNSRNSMIIGLISNGDGWHNNHHADQRAAAHGHKWWEFDVTYLTLRTMKCFGMAWDLVPITVKSDRDISKPDRDESDTAGKGSTTLEPTVVAV